jgi:hypothetical protein
MVVSAQPHQDELRLGKQETHGFNGKGKIMHPARLALVLAALFGIFSGAAFAAEGDRPKVATYAKVYRGPEGLTVSVLGIGDPANEEFLVQYSGINHDWNWKIFKATRVPGGTGHDYTIQADGGDYVTLIERGLGGGYTLIQAYIPKTADGAHMSYDEGLSHQVKPQHYLTDYLEQERGNPVRGAAWR